MKQVKFIAPGLLPLISGAALNAIVLARPDTIPPAFWIGVVFLLLWGALGYLLCGGSDSKIEVTVYAHIIGAIFLLLALIQEIVLRSYWFNMIGSMTQYYFLALLNLGFTLTPGIPYMWAAEIAAFVLMYGAFYLGCHIKKR